MKSMRDALVSIVIPCFNEKNLIEELIRRVNNSPLPKKEVILVDDASNDGTREIIKEKLEPRVSKVIYHDKNRGKGAALRSGFAAASGDIVIVQDADLEYDPDDYLRLLEPILSGKADVVYGSRFVGSGAHRVFFFWHMVGNKLLTLISNIFTNLNLTDMETGFKVFRAEILRKIKLKEDTFTFEPEVTAKIARLKCRIYEVGISYSGRTYTQGKKISWPDGFRALGAIAKYNLFE